MRSFVLAICVSILIPISAAAGDANCQPISQGNAWIQVTAQDQSCTPVNDAPCFTAASLRFDVALFGVSLQCGFTTFAWDFGDGTPGAFTSSADHAFSAPSTYHAAVTIAGPLGSVRLVKDVVVACAPRGPGDLQITHNPVSRMQGLGFDFAVTSSVTLQESCDSVQWSFGDGTQASGLTTTHAYAKPGTYTVEARVSRPSGLSATATETVVVQPLKRRAVRH